MLTQECRGWAAAAHLIWAAGYSRCYSVTIALLRDIMSRVTRRRTRHPVTSAAILCILAADWCIMLLSSLGHIHNIYTISTQYLHNIYSIYTVSAINIVSTQYLHSIYSIYTLSTVSTVSTHYLYSIYTVSGGNVAHFLHTTSCLHTADTRDWGISIEQSCTSSVVVVAAVLHLL